MHAHLLVVFGLMVISSQAVGEEIVANRTVSFGITLADSAINAGNEGVRYWDIDGDSLPDAVYFEGDRLHSHRNLGERKFGAQEVIGLSPDSMDIDGDGDFDRLDSALTSPGQGPHGNLLWREYLSETDEELPVATRVLPAAMLNDETPLENVVYSSFRLEDFNGDGAADILRLSYDEGVGFGVIEYIAFTPEDQSYLVVARHHLDELQSPDFTIGPDFDGDGLPSLALLDYQEGVDGNDIAILVSYYRVKGDQVGPLVLQYVMDDSYTNKRRAENVLFMPGTQAGETFVVRTRLPRPEDDLVSKVGELCLFRLDSDGVLLNEHVGDIHLDLDGVDARAVGGRYIYGFAQHTGRNMDIDRDGDTDLVLDIDWIPEGTSWSRRARTVVFYNSGDGIYSGSLSQQFRLGLLTISARLRGVFIDIDGDGESEFMKSYRLSSSKLVEVPLADLSTDGVVDRSDLSIFLTVWGDSYDFTPSGDDIMNTDDLAYLLATWGQTTE